MLPASASASLTTEIRSSFLTSNCTEPSSTADKNVGEAALSAMTEGYPSKREAGLFRPSSSTAEKTLSGAPRVLTKSGLVSPPPSPNGSQTAVPAASPAASRMRLLASSSAGGKRVERVAYSAVAKNAAKRAASSQESKDTSFQTMGAILLSVRAYTPHLAKRRVQQEENEEWDLLCKLKSEMNYVAKRLVEAFKGLVDEKFDFDFDPLQKVLNTLEENTEVFLKYYATHPYGQKIIEEINNLRMQPLSQNMPYSKIAFTTCLKLAESIAENWHKIYCRGYNIFIEKGQFKLHKQAVCGPQPPSISDPSPVPIDEKKEQIAQLFLDTLFHSRENRQFCDLEFTFPADNNAKSHAHAYMLTCRDKTFGNFLQERVDGTFKVNIQYVTKSSFEKFLYSIYTCRPIEFENLSEAILMYLMTSQLPGQKLCREQCLSYLTRSIEESVDDTLQILKSPLAQQADVMLLISDHLLRLNYEKLMSSNDLKNIDIMVLFNILSSQQNQWSAYERYKLACKWLEQQPDDQNFQDKMSKIISTVKFEEFSFDQFMQDVSQQKFHGRIPPLPADRILSIILSSYQSAKRGALH